MKLFPVFLASSMSIQFKHEFECARIAYEMHLLFHSTVCSELTVMSSDSSNVSSTFWHAVSAAAQNIMYGGENEVEYMGEMNG